MSNYINNKNGTQLCINPLMYGINTDINTCLDIIEHATFLNMTEDEFYQTAVYLSNLLSARTQLYALDNSSDGMPEIFRKYGLSNNENSNLANGEG